MGEAKRRKQLGLPPQSPKRAKVSAQERQLLVYQAAMGILADAVQGKEQKG